MIHGPAEILLVDDDAVVISALNALLAPLGRLRFATTGRDALRLARDSVPDLVLLDIELPDTSGLEVCRQVKADPLLGDVPVIFITSHDSMDTEVEGLACGAVDFIGKPLRHALVTARVRTHLSLKRLTDELRRAATVDGLTGAANRRGFDQTLAREWLRAQRSGRPLALLLVDLDHFKDYNDHQGHQAGDRALRAVAQALMAKARRPADLVARYGGDELAVLLPDTDRAGAEAIGQLLIEAVDRLAQPQGPGPAGVAVTVSVGLACAGPAIAEDDPAAPALQCGDELLAAADAALYEAKRRGRHRLCGVQHRYVRSAAEAQARLGPAEPITLRTADG